jgi:hypothetical protein
MYMKELGAVRPNRLAGSENSVLREAAGRFDEGMVTGLEQGGGLLRMHVFNIEK